MSSAAGSSSLPRKVALIIGNSNHSRVENRLDHAITNAENISRLLVKKNFEVEKHLNIKTEMMNIIEEFARKIEKGDVVLFYFSGHCHQAEGKNYLIPTDDVRIEEAREVVEYGALVDSAVERLNGGRKPYVTIVILDCSQPYFLKNELTSSSKGKGLKAMKPVNETFIQFACAANRTVRQVRNPDHKNLFTKHLLENIDQENVRITEIFQQIAIGVYEDSDHKQQPLSINGLRQHRRACLNEVTNDTLIYKCNERIRELKKELETLTRKAPHDGSVYNDQIGDRIGRNRALIHALELKRDRAINQRYSTFPIR